MERGGRSGFWLLNPSLFHVCKYENLCAAWTGTIRALRTFGRPPSVCGCSVGGQLKSYYLDHPPLPPDTMASQHHSSSPNLVGGHYRVGRKIGEGSFGVIFEGLLSFLRFPFPPHNLSPFSRQGRTSSTPRPSPSNSSVPIHPGARPCCYCPNPLHTGTSKGRSPPTER